MAKLKHIEANPNVTLNTNVGPRGGDVVVIGGAAEALSDAPSAAQLPAYLERYANGIKGLGMTPDSFAASYSVHVRITPTRVWTIP